MGTHIAAPLYALARREPERELLVAPQRMSALSVARNVASAAHMLAQAEGCGSERRIALALSTPMETFLSVLACASAGLIAVPLHARWSRTEALEACAAVGAELVVHDGENWQIAESFPSDKRVEWSSLIARTRRQSEEGDDLEEYATGGSGVAALFFTSGTSAKGPKAVKLTHWGIQSASLAKMACLEIGPSEVALSLVPAFHVGGVSTPHAALSAGARIAFPASSKPREAAGIVDPRSEVTFLASTPIALEMAIENGARSEDVRKILLGGSDPKPRMLDEGAKAFPNAVFIGSYGMTEASSSITFTALRHPPAPTETSGKQMVSMPNLRREHERGGVGFPAPGLDVRIAGENGEILVRGSQVMAGYWNRDCDGGSECHQLGFNSWLPTGDVGEWSPVGELMLLGRVKDVIRCGGENIQAREVEQTVCSIPGIDDAVAVGVPDERWGELVGLLVATRQVAEWPELEKCVQDACRSKGLGRFKVPRIVKRAEGDRLPLLASGKVDKLAALNILLE